MTALERRMELLRILVMRRQETEPSLAKELGVSVKTVRRDIIALTVDYPLETKAGKGGCIRVAEWYHPYQHILTREHQQVLLNMIRRGDAYEAHIVQQILEQCGSPSLKNC